MMTSMDTMKRDRLDIARHGADGLCKHAQDLIALVVLLALWSIGHYL